MIAMRIALMTANFAPRSGSHPTRTVHLTKYLRRLGHELAVITYDDSQHALYTNPDSSLAAKVPSDVEIERILPGWLHRWLGYAKRRGYQATVIKRRAVRNPLTSLMIPDPHCTARRSFVQAGIDLIDSWRPEVLVTFAYPFTMTLVGAALKQRRNDLIWIADYGDPWTGAHVAELKLPTWRRKVDAHLEARALARADAVTVTTVPTARLYRRQFPSLADRIHVVTMGYDPDDNDAITPAPRADANAGRIILLHAGRLYREARDPTPFIAAVDTCLAADPTIADRFRIVLLGEVEPAIRTDIEQSAAATLYEFHNWVAVDESVARMKSADYLLLFGNAGNLQIPGKVFQYIGTGRPVFMTCESDDDPTVDVLRQYGRATIVPNRTSDLASALGRVLADDATTDSPVHNHEQFSWPYLAAEIAAIAAQARVDREATP